MEDYKTKIAKMTDEELMSETLKVKDMLAQGYDRLGSSRDLLMEASITLCENAIKSIKDERARRKSIITMNYEQ